jgi:hypothetical protein
LKLENRRKRNGNRSNEAKISFLPLMIFLATLVTVLISLIPAIFPALLLRTFGGLENLSKINPFEIGIWGYPILFTNIVLLILGVLYLKKRLWQSVTKSIKLIFDFEVSKKVAYFVIVILIGSYVSLSIGELSDNKFHPDYYHLFLDRLENFSLTDYTTSKYAQLLLENLSMQLFGNYEVIPFLGSIALLALTYGLTVELTKKRFAGIIAMVIVLQSHVFLVYDTSVSYPNFWVLFYLLSLYLIFKKWPLSSFFYVASVLSKALTVPFLPMLLFFVYRAKLSRKKKIRIALSYGAIIAIGLTFLAVTNESLTTQTEFSTHDFWSGFTSIYLALRFDGLVLLFLLPLVVGLFIASTKGVRYADAIMFFIMASIISAPFVQALSATINVPYRFVPLIVFFAIGTGVLLSKREKMN